MLREIIMVNNQKSIFGVLLEVTLRISSLGQLSMAT